MKNPNEDKKAAHLQIIKHLYQNYIKFSLYQRKINFSDIKNYVGISFINP